MTYFRKLIMLFGFLFFEILLWVILPILLLCFLASDSQWWSATTVVFMVALIGHIFGWPNMVANLTNPIWLGNALQYFIGYAIVGLLFSFLKWKVLATKAATSFREYIKNIDFYQRAKAARPKPRNFEGKELPYSEAPTPEEILEVRKSAAYEWFRSSYALSNRLIDVKTADDASGWVTQYEKLRLTGCVTAWALYWPFYAILLVLDDFIRHIFTWFVERFGKMFQRMADASFSDIK